MSRRGFRNSARAREMRMRQPPEKDLVGACFISSVNCRPLRMADALESPARKPARRAYASSERGPLHIVIVTGGMVVTVPSDGRACANLLQLFIDLAQPIAVLARVLALEREQARLLLEQANARLVRFHDRLERRLVRCHACVRSGRTWLERREWGRGRGGGGGRGVGGGGGRGRPAERRTGLHFLLDEQDVHVPRNAKVPFARRNVVQQRGLARPVVPCALAGLRPQQLGVSLRCATPMRGRFPCVPTRP